MRLRGRLRATWDYLQYVYGSEWKYAIGLFGIVLGFVVAILPTSWVLAATLAGTLITILLFVLDTVALRSRWVKVPLHNNREERDTFPFVGAQWVHEGYGLLALPPLSAGREPTASDLIWTDPNVNRLLWTRAALTPIRLNRTPYRLPDELAEIAPQSLRRTAAPNQSATARTHRPQWFNGRLARLTTEPTAHTLGSSAISIQRVTYFDGQASNELWHWSRDEPISSGGIRLPQPFVVDTRRRILSLDHARVANIVGISVIAVTADRQILWVRQSARNSVDPLAFASSASGSLDWADAHKAVTDAKPANPTLADVLMRGMLRELHEESLVRQDEIVPGSERITGYFRWLNRGAKPEFCGLVRLSVTSADLRKRTLTTEERNYTDGHAVTPVEILVTTGAQGWNGNDEELIASLTTDPAKPANLGISTRTAWHLAADYVAANPQYLSRNSFKTIAFTKAGQFSRPGDNHPKTNEDFVYAGVRSLIVLDGATGLSDPLWNSSVSPARWFTQTVGEELAATLESEDDLDNVIRRALAKARKQWERFPGATTSSPQDRPTAAMALVRVSGTALEWAVLGDCRVLLKTSTRVEEYLPNEIRELDANAIRELMRISAAMHQSPAEARKKMTKTLCTNRALQNKPGGYAILDIDGCGITGLLTGTAPVNDIQAVAVASDGFADLWDGLGLSTPAEILNGLDDATIAKWVDTAFAARAADPEYWQYPRFKLQDDTSVAWARFY